jgi:3-hydroxybutyryl-CoA dehydrogenase
VARSFSKVGVVGLGTMGAGIAEVFARSGLEVVAVEKDAESLERGRGTVASSTERAVRRGKLTETEQDELLGRIAFGTSLADIKDAELVVEAVPERLDLKVRVFRDLDTASPDGTILASNTSGFPIAALAAATDRPDRVLGWHWASPPSVMRLAELVTTRETSDETVAAVREVAARCGKNPIVVKDTPMAWGFVTNRVYVAMVAEAQKVVSEGIAAPDDVDQLMVDCFRWPTGPFGMVKGATEGWSG